MDLYLNLKAFLATVDTGNFSRAARDLELAPSVVTKRVNQLEEQLGSTLFHRTTRFVTLTETGLRHVERAREIVAKVDHLMSEARRPADVEDFLRVKAPTAMTISFLGGILQDFLAAHPKVRMDCVVADRAIDPYTEGFDIAFGAFPDSFADVQDEDICPFDRLVCASPDYLARHGTPRHPRELLRHSCLSFAPTGNRWEFETGGGPISIELKPRFSSNDSHLVLQGAIRGNGIVLASSYSSSAALRAGKLVRILEDFPSPRMWIRAISPKRLDSSSAGRLLIDHVKAAMTPVPPWEREPAGDGLSWPG